MKQIKTKLNQQAFLILIFLGFAIRIVSCTHKDMIIEPPVNSSTDLLVVRVGARPVIDGIVDEQWEESPKLQFSTEVPEGRLRWCSVE